MIVKINEQEQQNRIREYLKPLVDMLHQHVSSNPVIWQSMILPYFEMYNSAQKLQAARINTTAIQTIIGVCFKLCGRENGIDDLTVEDLKTSAILKLDEIESTSALLLEKAQTIIELIPSDVRAEVVAFQNEFNVLPDQDADIPADRILDRALNLKLMDITHSLQIRLEKAEAMSSDLNFLNSSDDKAQYFKDYPQFRLELVQLAKELLTEYQAAFKKERFVLEDINALQRFYNGGTPMLHSTAPSITPASQLSFETNLQHNLKYKNLLIRIIRDHQNFEGILELVGRLPLPNYIIRLTANSPENKKIFERKQEQLVRSLFSQSFDMKPEDRELTKQKLEAAVKTIVTNILLTDTDFQSREEEVDFYRYCQSISREIVKVLQEIQSTIDECTKPLTHDLFPNMFMLHAMIPSNMNMALERAVRRQSAS